MMTKHNNRNGFTLIEIIVTVVILAVLMAVAMPTALKYLSEGDNAKALDEAYACVTAGDYYGARAYMKQKDPSKYINSEIIQKKAQVNGTITEFVYNDNTISHLIYTSTNDIIVEFNGKEYTIVETPTYGRSVIPILQELNKIANSSPTKEKYNSLIEKGELVAATQLLQKAYKDQNNGLYKKLSESEKNFLISKGSSKDSVEALYWKPMLDSYGNIIVVADRSPAAANSLATMIYVNNFYYYHTNGYNTTPDAHSITEGGLQYNEDGSPKPNATNPGKWYRVDDL